MRLSIGLIFLVVSQLIYAQDLTIRATDSLMNMSLANFSGQFIINEVDTINVRTNGNGEIILNQPLNSNDRVNIFLKRDEQLACMKENISVSKFNLPSLKLPCTLDSIRSKLVKKSAIDKIKSCDAQIIVIDPSAPLKFGISDSSIYRDYGFNYTEDVSSLMSNSDIDLYYSIYLFNKTTYEYLDLINGASWKVDLLNTLSEKSR